jgi:hypothetical protein
VEPLRLIDQRKLVPFRIRRVLDLIRFLGYLNVRMFTRIGD